MPGPGLYFGARLHAAIDSGAVSEATIADKSRRLLRLAARTRAFEPAAAPDQQPEQSIDTPEDRALIRRAAADATVLLRNARGALPLDPAAGGTLAVIGPLADALSAMGGGSSALTPHHVVQPLDAIRRAAAGAEIRFEPGCRIHRTAPALAGAAIATEAADGARVAGAALEYFDNPEFAGAPVHTATVRRLHLRWGSGEGGGWAAGQFSLRLRTTFTPSTSGTHRLALTSAGLSRLALDGAPLIDNWTRQERGDAFYGRGSAEVTADVALEAGRAYALTVEYRAPERRAGIAGLIVGCRLPEPPDAMERAVAAAAAADAAIVVAGLDDEWETEGRDRVSLALPGAQDELIARVAAANPRTIVVINAGSPVAMPWIDDVAAVLQCWYPGQEGGDAIADVLFGATDPGGRLPTTFPVRVEDSPAHLTYPGEAGTVSYGEGVFVGYRGFDRRATAPLFPFGHGLSYTTFEYGPVTVEPAEAVPGQPVEVRVAVRNTGARPGREVVQVYVHPAASSLLRPAQELRGFAKVALAPGEQREVRVTLDERAFAAWDPRAHDWVVEPGAYEVRVGASSRDLRGRASVRVG
jgi:beta-glucosidase